MLPPRHSSRVSLVIMILGAICLCGPAKAQSDYHPSPENLEARREFQDMKFGMFIHWGIYSVLGDGEWVFPTTSCSCPASGPGTCP